MRSDVFRYIRAIATFALVVFIGFVAWHFPYDVDPQQQSGSARGNTEDQTASNYYEQVYSAPESATDSSNEANSWYVEYNRLAAHDANIEAGIAEFVRTYHLQNARVLEIGAGSGKLQDIVDDYTGLDIAASAARYFHKPFVHGSATDLPFDDSSFDSIWSVWVLEHVPNPERALNEMRRVIRDGGIIFLLPSWNVPTWAAEGLNVRPYTELDWRKKISKSAVPIEQRIDFQMTYRIPVRILRWGYWRLTGGTTALRYVRLTPNYNKYWTADSDAVNSIDYFESLLWFISRGDKCLHCGPIGSEIRTPLRKPLIIRVTKK